MPNGKPCQPALHAAPLHKHLWLLATVALPALMVMSFPVHAEDAASENSIELDQIVVSGDGTVQRDAPAGISIISPTQLQELPVVNLNRALIMEPGVTMSGGRGGNKRQVDIRGMGSEYTVVLIDGVRVNSKDSARYTTGGARNTLGDTGWVPPGAVERVEVIRGPAAAIYGNGAIGGVINIITKKTTQKPTTTINALVELPENPKEGWTRQLDFVTSGSFSELASYRVYGNLAKRNPDAADINGAVDPNTGGVEDMYGLAGRDGISGGDFNALLSLKLNEQQTLEFSGGYGRQENLFAGEIWNYCGRGCSQWFPPTLMMGNGTAWNTVDRMTGSVSHRGEWDFGRSRITAAYEGTDNKRRQEQLGGADGIITSTDWQEPSYLRNYMLDGELEMPFEWQSMGHNVRLGFDLRRETLLDRNAMSVEVPNNGPKQDFMAANYGGVYIKDDIQIAKDWLFTPSIRMDDTTYGSHFGAGAYLAWNATEWLTLKGGIANPFKAPNVYQTNPSYAYMSYGNGCYGAGPCYILGNPDLKPETSINKEIGFQVNYEPVMFGLTYFDNDFRDKITTSRVASGKEAGCTDRFGRPATCNILMWENAQKARINGLEGRFRWAILDNLSLDANFTTFFQSKDLTTGETLSFTPKYTINATLSWQATEALTLNAIVQSYGKQESNSVDPSKPGNVLVTNSTIDPYTLVLISAMYSVNENLKVRAGISNLFNQQVLRESLDTTMGNNLSYNEPGRTYWAGLSATF